jgi:hypothetical protein
MHGRKKVLECRSGLHPSEKELLEQRSITKIPLILFPNTVQLLLLQKVQREK